MSQPDLCFREAFIHHVRATKTPVAAIARETGVSVEAMHKLMQRKSQTTSAENALAIAAYFGLTLEDFCDRLPSRHARVLALLDDLSPDEIAFLTRQLEGLVGRQDREQSTAEPAGA